MIEDKKWMLMTYYCPTHGDSGRLEPIEIKREEISKTFMKNRHDQKKINPQINILSNEEDTKLLINHYQIKS